MTDAAENSEMSVADYSQLSPDTVINAVESTGRISDARVLALNSYENRVYQVGVEDGAPVIAKFYRPQRWSPAQILEEHAYSVELAAAELPVIAPLADENGRTLFEFQGYKFALFPRKGGQALEAGDADQLHRTGMLLGRMHALAQQKNFQHRQALSLEKFIDAPSRFIQEHNFLPAALVARYIKIIATLKEKIISSGVLHARGIRTQGDCHPGNIIWTRDDGPWLLDFDDCLTAPAVQDFWMLLTGSRHEQQRQMAELIDGYEMFFEFNARELNFIEALRALRQVHYTGWLATRWADPAFPKYFPWFNTENYWQQHVAELEEQSVRMSEPALALG